MTCTPWYSARDYKPVRVGKYEYRLRATRLILLATWDGSRWLTVDGNDLLVLDGDRWRGLTEEHRG